MKYVNQKTSALLLTSALALILATNPVAQAIDIPLLDDALVIQGPTPYHTYNYGANPTLQVTNSGTIARWSYLKFDLQTALPPNTTDVDISKAWLYLWVQNLAAPGTFAVYTVTSWPATMAEGQANGAVSANTIAWNNKPTISASAILGTILAVPSGGDLEFIAIDVTSAVKAAMGTGGAFGLALIPQAGPGAQNIQIVFDAKETAVAIPSGGGSTRAGHQPRLDVTIDKKRVAARGDVSMGTYINGSLP